MHGDDLRRILEYPTLAWYIYAAQRFRAGTWDPIFDHIYFLEEKTKNIREQNSAGHTVAIYYFVGVWRSIRQALHGVWLRTYQTCVCLLNHRSEALGCIANGKSHSVFQRSASSRKQKLRVPFSVPCMIWLTIDQTWSVGRRMHVIKTLQAPVRLWRMESKCSQWNLKPQQMWILKNVGYPRCSEIRHEIKRWICML
jgi:hypothetical protein